MLPKLPNIKQLSPFITRILGQNPGNFCLQGTNTYLIGSPSSTSRVLVDCGEGLPEYSKLLKEYLDTEKLQLSAIIVTHWHQDHLNGVLPTLEHLGIQVPVYKYPSFRDEDFAIKFTYVQDGEKLSLCGADLVLLHTPGHADDHMVIYVEQDKVMLSADNVLGHGTSSYVDYQEYMKSLQRMREYPGLSVIYPGHGEIIENGPAKLDEYINHRLQREKQVLDIVNSDGPITSEQITLKLYQDVPENVMLAAKHGVDQFLLKLEADGKIANDGLDYVPKNYKL